MRLRRRFRHRAQQQELGQTRRRRTLKVARLEHADAGRVVFEVLHDGVVERQAADERENAFERLTLILERKSDGQRSQSYKY